MISEGSVERDRIPDLRRCERIAWPRPMIDRYPDKPPSESDPILWWRNTRRREQRVLIALPDFSYVVIMADRGNYIMPWTAYPVEHTHRQRKLKREYETYWKNQTS